MNQLALLEVAPTVQMGAEDNEFYTPALVRAALPPIDLDPCASPWSLVQARRRIIGLEGGDGLAEPWGPVHDGRGPLSLLRAGQKTDLYQPEC